MILPDSTIEVAARKAYASFVKRTLTLLPKPKAWERLTDAERAMVMEDTRAALTAALPDLIEICAKAAEGAVEGASESENPYAEGRRDAATLIRSLLTTPEDK